MTAKLMVFSSEAVRTDSYMGAASYRIEAQNVAPYEDKAR